MRLAAGMGLVAALAAGPGPKGVPVDYNRDVRPILSKNCLACHGMDPGKRAAGLRLDVRDEAVREQKSGNTAIVPGEPDESELIARVTAADELLRMPPRKAGPRLGPAEVDVLKRWVAQGATYAEHWAFVKPQDRPLPAVHDRAWPRNGIDFWILARLEKEGLKPAPEADRVHAAAQRLASTYAACRPRPQEVDRFVADSRPTPTRRPSTGSWPTPPTASAGRGSWLDLARYADSAGYGSDPSRTIWRYRDWVIDAFNRNMPYDRFTVEQFAGDLLPERHARAEDGHGVPPQHDDQHRGRHRRRGVPRRRRQGPGRHHDGRSGWA